MGSIVHKGMRLRRRLMSARPGSLLTRSRPSMGFTEDKRSQVSPSREGSQLLLWLLPPKWT